jgi:hypothetical protein
MGGHLESTHFYQSEASTGAIGREEFINAEFGTMRVSRQVCQQVAEDAIDEPWWHRLVVS